MRVEECVFFQLAKASQKATQFFNQQVAHLNLTAVQAMILSFLVDEDRVPAGQLGDRVQLTSATMTGIIDRIEKLGLVERKPHPDDRRAILLCLTDKGVEVGSKLKEIVQASNEQYMKELSPEEEVFFRGILKRLHN